MTPTTLASAGRPLATVLAVALIWAALYRLNDLWAESLAWSDGVTWVFLPAALRPLAVLVFGLPGAAGLFLGSVLALTAFTDAPAERIAAIAAISALAPLVAVTCVIRCLHVGPHLIGLTTTHLMLVVVATAALSVGLHNLYYWGAEMHVDPYSGLLPMFVGDLLGTFVVLYMARLALRVYARARASGPAR